LRALIAVLVILGVINAVLQQITQTASVDARELNVKVSSEDFWKILSPLLKQSINETIEDDK
jgi:hypothetical protein